MAEAAADLARDGSDLARELGGGAGRGSAAAAAQGIHHETPPALSARFVGVSSTWKRRLSRFEGKKRFLSLSY